MNDKECIKDLETLQEFYRLIYGAEPSCLGYAKDRLKELDKNAEINPTGETRKE